MDDERLIYASELLEILRKKHKSETDFGVVEGLQFAMDEINKLLCKPEPSRWISCKDELPRFATRVLVTAVCDPDKYPQRAKHERQFIAMRLQRLTAGEWYWANGAEMYSYDGVGGMIALAGWEIIAWQPLPEEYREES